MSKNISHHTAPNTAPKEVSLNSALTQNIVGTADVQLDFQSSLDAMARRNEAQASSLGFGVGRLLRATWNFLTRNLRVGLPVAEATPHDNGLSKLIKNYPIQFITDQEFLSSKHDSKLSAHEKKVGENVRGEFLKAAGEGAQTRELIEKCLSRNIKIGVFDPTYSKESRKKLPYGGDFAALYLTRENALILNSNFDGKNLVGNIIHECSHVRDYAEGITAYDDEKMQTCIRNLSDLGVKAIRCMDEENPEQEWCDHLANLAEGYRNRPLLMHKKRVGEKQINAGVAVASLATGISSNKHEGSLAVMSLKGDKEGRVYELNLKEIRDGSSSKKPSQRQKNLHKMAMQTRELEAEKKSKHPTEERRKLELHTSITEFTTEEVLDEFCPEGFEEEPRKTVKKSSSKKVQQVPEKEL